MERKRLLARGGSLSLPARDVLAQARADPALGLGAPADAGLKTIDYFFADPLAITEGARPRGTGRLIQPLGLNPSEIGQKQKAAPRRPLRLKPDPFSRNQRTVEVPELVIATGLPALITWVDCAVWL